MDGRRFPPTPPMPRHHRPAGSAARHTGTGQARYGQLAGQAGWTQPAGGLHVGAWSAEGQPPPHCVSRRVIRRCCNHRGRGHGVRRSDVRCLLFALHYNPAYIRHTYRSPHRRSYQSLTREPKYHGGTRPQPTGGFWVQQWSFELALLKALMSRPLIRLNNEGVRM